MEEICGLMGERAAKQQDTPLLTQLTLIAEPDGSFRLHLRDNGSELNPFDLKQGRLQGIPLQVEKTDFRALGIHAVKTHARQFLYRNYQGFNTMTVVV